MKYKNFLANFAFAKLLDPKNYATFLFCYYKTAAQFLTIFLVESVIFLFFPPSFLHKIYATKYLNKFPGSTKAKHKTI